MARYVIVGGGIAGTQAAETVRRLCPDDSITLVAEEERPFYMRPLLADFVAGRLEEKTLWRDFASVASASGMRLILGQQVVGIGYRPERTVSLGSGEKLTYDRLLIATGAEPSLPAIPGIELSGVTTFSTYSDAVRVKGWVEKAKAAVVVGLGLQALELTRALRLRGLTVTLVAPDDTPWFLPLFQTDQQSIERVLEEHGVKVVALDRPIELIGDGGRVRLVKTREGKELPAEIVGFAGGQQPRLELLKGSDIGVDDGVLADEQLRTTDEEVFAAGDVAQIQPKGSRRALGYGWMRASAQGEVAGRNMCGERATVTVGDEFQAQSLYGLSLAARWR